jgi:hypothetical protein
VNFLTKNKKVLLSARKQGFYCTRNFEFSLKNAKALISAGKQGCYCTRNCEFSLKNEKAFLISAIEENQAQLLQYVQDCR